ncbi:MAG: Gfo/Idh/MocA family protein [Verrucomicrobiales bacterium]
MAKYSPSHSSRRHFLRTAFAGTAALSFSPNLRAVGANEDVRVAVIGTGGQGSGHCSRLLKDTKGCRLVAVCDADYEHGEQNKRAAEKHNAQISTYIDYRKLIENKDIDAVIIATPNHLHSLIGVAALQAGKHVYVEKPVSHNIWEGRQLAQAAAKNPQLVAMHGMQRRSSAGWHEVAEWAKDKNCPLGKLLISRGLCYKKRDNIGKCGGPQPPPPSVDYNLWSGPREMLPIMRKRFHYDWHWQWPWGNGDIGNQGPHQLDVARWMVGDPQECPTAVLSIGGRFGYEDDATTANTQIAFFDYKPVPVIFEVRGLPRQNMDFKQGAPIFGKTGVDVGNILDFEGGMVAENVAYDKEGKKLPQKFGEAGGGNHQQNFVNAIKAGKLLEPGHSVLSGHLSAALAHLANVSYRIGRATAPAEIKEKIHADKDAVETFDRMRSHLSENGVDIDKAHPVLGPALTFDPKTEKFTGDAAEKANEVATEQYRKEFSITV